jgi:hypothetical protein
MARPWWPRTEDRKIDEKFLYGRNEPGDFDNVFMKQD